MKNRYRNKAARQTRIQKAIVRTEALLAQGGLLLEDGKRDKARTEARLAELKKGLTS